MTMYLRAKTNGVVLDYNELLVNHEDWELVTEQQAFPEKFAPVDIKTREKKVTLTVDDASVKPPVEGDAELSKQKGRLFSTVGEVQAIKPKAPALDVTGLKGEF